MKTLLHPRFAAMAFLAVLLSCSGDSPTESAPTPAQIQATAGSGQAGVAEMPLAGELVARVTERKGKPVSGVRVTWTVAPEAGTLSSTTTTTDSNGEVRTQWTLGPSAGTFTVTASAAGMPPATFTATAAPAPPARVEKTGGDGQTGAPAGPLPDSLAVRVTSAGGRPVPGATVAWSVAAGGGTLGAAALTTDAAGIAKVAWTLGAAGPGTVTAGVGTLPPVTFTATAIPVASVSVSRASASVGRGDTLRLAATPRDAAGSPLAGRVVTWSSSAPSTASVDGAGVVSGLAYGRATITATSEGQSASATITVNSEDRSPPKLKSFSISPASVDVTHAPARVEVTASVADAGSGTKIFDLRIVQLSPTTAINCGSVLASGSPQDGVWKCTLTIPKGTSAGTWLLHAFLQDAAGNFVNYHWNALRSAGYPDSLVVTNSAPPTTPALAALSLSPTAVDVSEAEAEVEVLVAATAGEGVRRISTELRTSRGIEYSRYCGVELPTSAPPVTSGTFRCRLTIPRNAPAGPWNLAYVVVQDRAGATRDYEADDLKIPGFSSTLQVTSRTEDLTGPTLDAFSLSARSVDLSTGPKSVEAALTATDAETGVLRAQVRVRGPDGSTITSPTQILDGTAKTAALKCTFPFASSSVSGPWEVTMVTLYDPVGNSRTYDASQLRAAGFPTTLTITR